MQDEMQSSVPRQALAGAQMLFVAFGALVLMPLITGMDPNVALFTAGIGTLLFQLVTKRQVPVFLASSFAFIAPILAAKNSFGMPAVMGGIIAAGFMYVLLSLAVQAEPLWTVLHEAAELLGTEHVAAVAEFAEIFAGRRPRLVERFFAGAAEARLSLREFGLRLARQHQEALDHD